MSGADTSEGYEVVARYHVEDESNEAVEALLLHGTGAFVEHQDHEAPFALLVVAGGGDRARQTLGLPAVVDPDTPVDKPARPQIFWVIAIFLAAMIILPVVGFYVSFKLSGG